MDITGVALIGGLTVQGALASFHAYDPTLRAYLEPPFHTVDAGQIGAACLLAEAAFDEFRATPDDKRATFLDTIALHIDALGDRLISRAMAETALPRARLDAERGRTTGQLRLFATLLREGSWCDARLDSPQPKRQPPRPDLRMRLIGLGPVAVFGPSNFPLAYSVAGGDTAAALAAGCPVLVKAHPAHPGTSELVGRALQAAVLECGLPPGVFALLTGAGNDVGQQLVAHPAVRAVGFTGSRGAGLALMAVAAARPRPIPVYAEMSSVNPVFLLPKALARHGPCIAAEFAAALTLGVGQCCTKPGIVVGLLGRDFERFCDAAAAALADIPPGVMLTPGIAARYQRGVECLRQHPEVLELDPAQPGFDGLGRLPLLTLVAPPRASTPSGRAVPALFVTSAAAFLADGKLADESFGPCALLVACRSMAQMRAVAEQLEGQLTATLHMDDGDLDDAAQLLPVLERKAGRIVANGFPTGVEVAPAMVHGGHRPLPAPRGVPKPGAAVAAGGAT